MSNHDTPFQSTSKENVGMDQNGKEGMQIIGPFMYAAVDSRKNVDLS